MHHFEADDDMENTEMIITHLPGFAETQSQVSLPSKQSH
jgi:hypothetical protein